MNGIVFDIQRFALHDGPGIRTTVFLKGCPLRCRWCHNPESWSFAPQLSFDPERCMGCTACVAACDHDVHWIDQGAHRVRFDRCHTAANCVAACPHDALTIIGRAMTVDQVIAEVIRDEPYYRRSGGGLTISGGEPLAQFDFTRALLRAAKQHGLHTCLDTTGLTHRRRLEQIVEDIDLFLYDYKATDPATHRALTGVTNELILANLDYLYRQDAQIVLRCPLVPGINDTQEHLAGIAAIAARYPRLVGIQIMAYHTMGRDKAARVGYDQQCVGVAAADEAIKDDWMRHLHELGCTTATFG